MTERYDILDWARQVIGSAITPLEKFRYLLELAETQQVTRAEYEMLRAEVEQETAD